NAGLNIIGKTATPEFGLTLTTEPISAQPCRNPWNLDYSTGGSSGGAAAAVAAGIVAVAHATDGGGSIRIPASCCGLVGLKPSRGLTASATPLAASWSGMSVGHVVSRTVRDSALFLDTNRLHRPGNFALPDIGESFVATLERVPQSLRIALHNMHPLDRELDKDCKVAVEQAGKLCESLGHQVTDCVHPLDYRPLVKAMGLLINLHTWQAVKPFLIAQDIDLDDAPLESSTRLLAGLGRDTSADEYIAARDVLRQAELTMAQYHRDVDVIVSPVLAKTPARLGWLDMNSDNLNQYGQRYRDYSGFTAVYNGTGQPSLSLPLHRSALGLPVGVQFTAAWGNDSSLLQLARQLELAQPWPQLAPAYA
ncbi:MAG: amidase family protein, partial [Gammaproteobacteria bacterium]